MHVDASMNQFPDACKCGTSISGRQLRACHSCGG